MIAISVSSVPPIPPAALAVLARLYADNPAVFEKLILHLSDGRRPYSGAVTVNFRNDKPEYVEVRLTDR